MKLARLALAFALLLAVAPVADAAWPEDKVAVVRVQAVDGLAVADAAKSSRSSSFVYDGTAYTVDRDALSSLEGVRTVVLIDRSSDTMTGGVVTREHSQEVRTFSSTQFEIDFDGQPLHYQVATVGGVLRLMGDGDQIRAVAGNNRPFHIWKITGLDLVDKSSFEIR